MKEILKEKKGITLIILIITVILMIILVGVSVSYISGEGVFSKAESTKIMAKKQSIIDIVNVAKTQLDVYGSSGNFDIVDLMNKVKEISDINDEKYDITIDEEEQSAVIVEKADNIVVDVYLDQSGKVTTNGYIADGDESYIKPTLTYVLDPAAGISNDQVTIRLTAAENVNGIAKIYLPDGNVVNFAELPKEAKHDYSVTKNGTYKFIAESAIGRVAVKYVTVKNASKVENITFEADKETPTNENVNLTINYDPNVKINSWQTLSNKDRFQYKLGENGEWKIANSASFKVAIDKNTTVYARYFDGKDGYSETSKVISNIDKLNPIIALIESSNVTETGFTLNVTGEDASETDEYMKSGVVKYEIYINGNLEHTENTTNLSAAYNVTGKRAASSYECKVRVYDAVGNYKDSEKLEVVTEGETRIALAVKVGDYINYDAGIWRLEDIALIPGVSGERTSSVHDTVYGEVVGVSSTIGAAQYPEDPDQFGGFAIGMSRNVGENSGWRVWDIEGDVVTLISEACPEYYYFGYGGYYRDADPREGDILGSRNMSMYLNEYSTYAKILNDSEIDTWYNENIDSTVTSIRNVYPFFVVTDNQLLDMLLIEENYWIGPRNSSGELIIFTNYGTNYSYGEAAGIRVLVTLKSGLEVNLLDEDEKGYKHWKIVEN